MLPFLKTRKPDAGIAMEYRKPDEDKPADDDQSGLEAAFDDLCKAVQTNDKRLGVEALRAAFSLLDSEPHVEGPHLEDEQE